MTTKYSFLAPAYKGRFIEEAVRSMMAQTFEDFCVVVSDDCSPENLEEALSQFKSDPKFSFVRNDTNIGAEHLVDHWNKLLSQTESEYVIIASDDDVYDKEFLAGVDRLVNSHPECDVFHVRSRVIDAKGATLKEDGEIAEHMSSDGFLEFLLSLSSVLCIGNYVFRTAALKDAGGFVNFPLAWKSDTATQLLLAKNGVATTPDILFSFRSSGLNISSKKGSQQNDRLKLLACVEFRNWMKEHSIGDCRQISKRIEGEMRSYYKVLSFGEFRKLYSSMLRDEWFSSCRSKLSFVFSYIF